MVDRRWHWRWLLGCCVALYLAGCQPWAYESPPPGPPPPPPPAPPAAVSRPIFYVTANRLNLRACAGMDCPKISVLEKNEAVEKVGEAEDWAQVRVKRDGRLGWVNGRYLSSQPLAPEAPPAPPPTAAPPPVPEAPPAVKPPVAEKPKPAKPPEPAAPPAKKKAEEPRPPKPAEAAEPPPKKHPAEKPAPREKAPPAPEKPAPPTEPTPGPEPQKRIRIM